jgi:hypothetical protein
MDAFTCVMTGLDPVIQPQTRSLDDRVKPGHDGWAEEVAYQYV